MPSPKGWCRTSLYSHRKCNFAECLIFNSPPSLCSCRVLWNCWQRISNCILIRILEAFSFIWFNLKQRVWHDQMPKLERSLKMLSPLTIQRTQKRALGLINLRLMSSKIVPFQHNSLHPIHNLRLSTRSCNLPYIFTCQLIFAWNPTLNSE
jgi:hypothetical protein